MRFCLGDDPGSDRDRETFHPCCPDCVEPNIGRGRQKRPQHELALLDERGLTATLTPAARFAGNADPSGTTGSALNVSGVSAEVRSQRAALVAATIENGRVDHTRSDRVEDLVRAGVAQRDRAECALGRLAAVSTRLVGMTLLASAVILSGTRCRVGRLERSGVPNTPDFSRSSDHEASSG